MNIETKKLPIPSGRFQLLKDVYDCTLPDFAYSIVLPHVMIDFAIVSFVHKHVWHVRKDM